MAKTAHPKIPIDALLGQNHKPRKLSRLLSEVDTSYQIGPAEYPLKAIGHLMVFWGSVSLLYPDGKMEGIDPEEIAGMAGWTGDPEVFLQALIDCNFLERAGKKKSYLVHDWSDYGGKLLVARKGQASRQKQYRTRHLPKETPPPEPEPKQPEKQSALSEVVSEPAQKEEPVPAPAGVAQPALVQDPESKIAGFIQPGAAQKKQDPAPAPEGKPKRARGRTKERLKQEYPDWYKLICEQLYEPLGRNDVEDSFQAIESLLAAKATLQDFAEMIALYDREVPPAYPRSIRATSGGKWLQRVRAKKNGVQPGLFTAEKEQSNNGRGRETHNTPQSRQEYRIEDHVPPEDLAILRNFGKRWTEEELAAAQ